MPPFILAYKQLTKMAERGRSGGVSKKPDEKKLSKKNKQPLALPI